MADNNLKTASVLAFERKLDPSDAVFFSGAWDDRNDSGRWPGVTIQEKSVRGTISNRLKAKDQDPAKLDAAIENPNLQKVDVAALPPNADTLKVKFTLRVLGGTGEPSACNDAAYRARLLDVVNAYRAQLGFGELAQRYAWNLANGRFLWRNRIGAEQVEIHIAQWSAGQAQKTWIFNALSFSLNRFDSTAMSGALGELATLIESGLNGEHVLLDITAYIRIGLGQEVFPSQELILDRGRGDKSKTLYKVGDVAGIHSQKLGNALRSIDSWYPGAEQLGPIAVEPYGSVTTQGRAYRQPKDKQDFYSLLDGWLLKDKTPDEGNQHFVMAVLVRGGVFGDAG